MSRHPWVPMGMESSQIPWGEHPEKHLSLAANKSERHQHITFCKGNGAKDSAPLWRLTLAWLQVLSVSP